MIKFTQRQKVLLTSICFSHICNGLTMAIQAPIYPLVAASKGVPPTEYSFVFGIYKLVSFLVCPILGQFINVIGAKFMMLSGIFIVGTTSILFGLLDLIQDKTTFIAFSFLIRIVEAYGNACYLTASISIATEEFLDSLFIISVLEVFYGIGLFMSPCLGGILYQVGGFITPFALIGLLLFVTGITLSFILPISDTNTQKSNYTVFHLLKNFEITLFMIANLAGYINIGFIDVTLSVYLEEFGLSPAFTGLMFLLNSLSFAISLPVWALIGHKYIQYKYVVVLGCTSVILAFLFLGPAPYFPFQPSIGLMVFALILNGVGIGAIEIASFIGSQKEAVNYGLPKDLSTFGLVSGLWTSTLALGLFVGSTCAGVLVEYYGFRNASMCVILLFGLLLIVYFIWFIMTKNGRVKMSKIHESELSSVQKNTEQYFSIEDSSK